ncbi:GNAT family N-acetyltransferase [Thiotrichales bacterium 19X7-9]|nr:GNAT family N-acetyltransferase [Thiotrichales bacterium 19X7-9]
MSQVNINLNLHPSKVNDDYIRKKLSEFNIAHTGEDKHYSVYATDSDNKLIGGILVYTEISSIFIDILWVETLYRNRHIGSKLLAVAENEAIKRNILYSTVDTFAFQAPDFYLKNDYKEIGVIKNYIEGHDRIFFRKKLKLKNS